MLPAAVLVESERQLAALSAPKKSPDCIRMDRYAEIFELHRNIGPTCARQPAFAD
jgi:hypothetical protein